MIRNTENNRSYIATEAPWSQWGLAAMFILVLFVLGSAIIAVTIHDAKAWTLPGLLLVSIFLSGIQILETREQAAVGNGRAGFLVFLSLVTAVTFLIYSPTLHVYFFSDDIGCLHAFHQPSLDQFLRMFHTDLAQLVEGENGQEIRPFYDLFYMVNYKLWGLNPVGYHLTSLLADILNSVLVFAMANKVAPGNQLRAGFAGLLFAVQPVHSMAVSWIAGTPAELAPTLFYLASFFWFTSYCATRKGRYLWLSFLAFAACLLCKEIAVTLPIMLFSYDLFRQFERKLAIVPGDASIRQPQRRRFLDLLPYLPFLLLLLGYLEWRHIVFSHFLGESFWADAWNDTSNGAIPGTIGMLHGLAHFLRYLGGEQIFNLRALLLLLPAISLALVLGLLLVWAIQLLRNKAHDRRAIVVVLYFGIVWYIISGLPLLVAAPDARHLYLPAVGPCIAIAFLAMPTSLMLRKRAGYSRLLGPVLLVLVFGLVLRRENKEWIEYGEDSEKVTTQMATAVGAMPQNSLLIILAPGGETLPFALQTPFASMDLYSRMQIIESPGMSSLPRPEWWQKTRTILDKELSGAPDESIEVNLLAWDDASKSVRQASRSLSKELIQSSLVQSVGSNPETVESVTDQQADDLVGYLVQLVAYGTAETRVTSRPVKEDGSIPNESLK